MWKPTFAGITHVCELPHILFGFVITSCLVEIIDGSYCLKDGILKEGMYLNTSTFTELSHSTIFSCAASCYQHAICRSFNFNKYTKTCFLNFGDDLTGLYVTDEKENFIYSSIGDWPKGIAGPCAEHTCQKDERCEMTRNKAAVCVRSPSYGVNYKVQFVLSDEEKDWDDSVTECSKLYGNLAVVDTQNKSDTVERMLRDQGVADFVWLGATEIEVQGQWKWVDGREMTFDMWSSYYNQPADTLGKEDCLATIYDNRNTFWNWFDRKCGDEYLFLCEVVVHM